MSGCASAIALLLLIEHRASRASRRWPETLFPTRGMFVCPWGVSSEAVLGSVIGAVTQKASETTSKAIGALTEIAL